MLSQARSILLFSLLALFMGLPAQALTIQSASIGDGKGCTDLACTVQTHTFGTTVGTGGGTVDLSGSTLTFSISGLGATLNPMVGFTNMDFTGTATVVGAGLYAVTTGSATVTGQIVDAGFPAAINTNALTVGGTCSDLTGDLSCGLVFSFTSPVDGTAFTQTVNLITPEPATAGLLGLVVIGLAARRRA